MSSSRNVLAVLVLTGAVLTARVQPVLAGRLGETVTPVLQSIDLRLDAGTPDYSGSVRIDIVAHEKTHTFQFHAENITLDTVTLTGDNKKNYRLTHETGEKGVVTVTTEEPLVPGDYRLDITFTDDFNTDAVGLYRVEMDGLGYSFTQFEADDAREAFPCWDEPIFKIPYQMTLTVPEGHMAITNTPVKSETTKDGWVTTVFRKSKPMPSYLLAIATGPLETMDMPGLSIPGRIVSVRGQSQLGELAVEMTPPILKALEEWFGSKYPYEKLDFIGIPEYWPGAMENPGAITFRDDILLLETDKATVGEKSNLARVVAHELAHMWFGDLVTMEWWDDLWLNESFADWLGDKTAHKTFPEYGRDLYLARDSQRIMIQDATPSTFAIRRPVESTDQLMEGVGLAYHKGKTVLGMFEQWLGPEDFRKGVVSYINANAWGNATADDLWRALDEASGKTLSVSMVGFLEQPGLPLVTVENLGGGKIRLAQRRFHNYGATGMENLIWSVPVGLQFFAGETEETRTVLLTAESETVDLGMSFDAVFPNTGGLGYYRWSLPPDDLKKLAETSGEHLTAPERIAFLGNVGALLQAGEVSGGDYLYILNALASDPEPMVLVTLLDALDRVRQAFVPDELEDAFAVYLQRTLTPALERVGLESRPGEPETMSLIRPRLIAYLGDEGQDPAVLEFAKAKAKAYMEDPSSVDPSIVRTALSLNAMDGDAVLFDAYRTRAENAGSPAERELFLQSLGGFRSAELQDRALDYSLAGSVRPTEIFTVTRGLGGTNQGQDRLFKWLTENYRALGERLPGEYMSFMPLMAGGCSESRLEKAKGFFGKNENQAPGTKRRLATVSDAVTDCLSLREREGATVEQYLRGFTQEP